jgi:hypothetical protein
MYGLTRRETKRFIESQRRFFERRQVRAAMKSLQQRVRDAQQLEIASEQARKILMISKKFRKSYLRWRASKRPAACPN